MDTAIWFDMAFLVAVVIALTNLVKKYTDEKLGYWYMVISVALGFVMYAIALYAPEFVKVSLLIGFAASGIYDIYKKT